MNHYAQPAVRFFTVRLKTTGPNSGDSEKCERPREVLHAQVSAPRHSWHLSCDSECYQVHVLVKNNRGTGTCWAAHVPNKLARVVPQGPEDLARRNRAGRRSGIKIRPQGKEAKSGKGSGAGCSSLWRLRQSKGPSSSFLPLRPVFCFPILLPLPLPHLPALLRLLHYLSPPTLPLFLSSPPFSDLPSPPPSPPLYTRPNPHHNTPIPPCGPSPPVLSRFRPLSSSSSVTPRLSSFAPPPLSCPLPLAGPPPFASPLCLQVSLPC